MQLVGPVGVLRQRNTFQCHKDIMDDVRSYFGQRVRELRRQKGLSQKDLAAKAKLHRAYLGGVERGERNVAVENIAKIAEALDEPISSLFALSGDSAAKINSRPDDENRNRLVKLFSTVPLVATAVAVGGLASAAASPVALSALGGGAVAMGGAAAVRALLAKFAQLEEKVDQMQSDAGLEEDKNDDEA